eukprot:5431060-Pyramimonas_sp.AAC.1
MAPTANPILEPDGGPKVQCKANTDEQVSRGGGIASCRVEQRVRRLRTRRRRLLPPTEARPGDRS